MPRGNTTTYSGIEEVIDIGTREMGIISIMEGSDADVILLDKNIDIDTVIAKGNIMIENGDIKVLGTYE